MKRIQHLPCLEDQHPRTLHTYATIIVARWRAAGFTGWQSDASLVPRPSRGGEPLTVAAYAITNALGRGIDYRPDAAGVPWPVGT